MRPPFKTIQLFYFLLFLGFLGCSEDPIIESPIERSAFDGTCTGKSMDISFQSTEWSISDDDFIEEFVEGTVVYGYEQGDSSIFIGAQNNSDLNNTAGLKFSTIITGIDLGQTGTFTISENSDQTVFIELLYNDGTGLKQIRNLGPSLLKIESIDLSLLEKTPLTPPNVKESYLIEKITGSLSGRFIEIENVFTDTIGHELIIDFCLDPFYE